MSSQDKILFAHKLELLIGKSDKKKICTDLNIKDETLLDWLRARKYPTKQSINKLAEYFGVNPNKLIGDTVHWHMSDEEIIRNYQKAENKKAQIGILADLNDVSIKMMKQKLESLGLLKMR